MFDLTSVQPIIQFLHNHPHGGAGLLAFVVVFAEALAVIGVIIPGSVTMTAVGILIGSAVIPARSTFMWAIAGAILGDYLSYLLGIYFQDRLHKYWPFTKYPQLLDKSETFFRNHGGKSVIIGRFVGPMRAMIPMVAGMFKMPQGRFLMAAIPSASLWAVGYMIPGVILGALSLELPPRAAFMFTIGILIVIAVVWLLIWLLQHFFIKVWGVLDFAIMKLWHWMLRRPGLGRLANFLADPREPDNHHQLMLSIFFIIFLTVFVTVFYSVIHQGFITSLNQPVFAFLSSIRTNFFDGLAILVTMLADKKVILVSGLGFGAWLIKKRYWHIAWHWLALMLLTTLAIFALKYSFFEPRPLAYLQLTRESSFPSGHTAYAVAFFGFMAVIIARELRASRKKAAYVAAGIIVVLVALTRIYLGAHWLNDILGSIFLGVALVLGVTIFYRRRHSEAFSPMVLSAVAVGIFLVCWLGFTVVTFSKEFSHYLLRWPSVTLTTEQWYKQQVSIPLYRMNRLGIPVQAFNVQWVGDLERIKKQLQHNGFVDQPVQLNFQKMVQSLSSETISYHFSILPQLYQNKPPVLVMIKKVAQPDTLVIFRVWDSNIILQDSKYPLWLGEVEYHQAVPIFLKIKNHQHQKTFFAASETVVASLKGIKYKAIAVNSKQPHELADNLEWDGKVLLINQNGN